MDAALVGVYLTGTNTRRLKGALAPVLRGGPLGKDAVSRLVGRLQSDFEVWRTRDLSEEDVADVFLDGWYPVVRIGKQPARVAILVTLAVRTTGERVVLDRRLGGQETAAGWADAIAALVGRGLRAPAWAVIDGNAGWARALTAAWPKIELQRCVVHKLRNLEAKAPVPLREEVAEDFRRLLYADTAAAVAKERVTFTKKWRHGGAEEGRVDANTNSGITRGLMTSDFFHSLRDTTAGPRRACLREVERSTPWRTNYATSM